MAKIPRLLMSPAVLTRMLSDPKFLAAFPFLKHPPKAKAFAGGCTGCGRGRSDAYDWHALKRSIAGLSSDRKSLLKTMLDAQQIKLIYRMPSGAMQTVFF